MKKRRYFNVPLFFLAITTLLLQTPAADQSPTKYRYLQKAGNKTDTATQTLSVSGGVVTIHYSDTKGSHSESQLNAENYQSKSWHFVDPKKKTDITITRDSTSLHITGTLKNKPIDRDQQIDTLPWFQSLEHSLARYNSTAGSGAEFWIVRPTDCSVFKMKLRRNDKAAAADKGSFELSMSPSGVSEHLWKATMLVSAAGSFIQSYLPSLIPGKPPIVEILLSSEPEI